MKYNFDVKKVLKQQREKEKALRRSQKEAAKQWGPNQQSGGGGKSQGATVGAGFAVLAIVIFIILYLVGC